MDAEAYLRKQGWKGSGHSLDSSGRGIKKPLLIAHKQDQLGLGKRKAAHATDDQWWMRAFDESLKNIGTGQDSTLAQIREKGINRGGLYGFFVRGEGLEGTIAGESEGSETSVLGSGASTPPTSAEEGSLAAKEEEKSKKRKRRGDADAMRKKAKGVGKEGCRSRGETLGDKAVDAKLAKLSPEERAQYASRAAAKGQSIAEYVLRRIVKKDVKKAGKKSGSVSPAPEALFVIDVEGEQAPIGSVPFTYTLLDDGSVPLDPTIWEGRKVKMLPKEVRRARREWMRQRSTKREKARAEASGKSKKVEKEAKQVSKSRGGNKPKKEKDVEFARTGEKWEIVKGKEVKKSAGVGMKVEKPKRKGPRAERIERKKVKAMVVAAAAA